MITAPNFTELDWLTHGFGIRDSEYPSGICTIKQIHSKIVLEAPGDPVREGDALISNKPGVIIGIRTADCVPILIADFRHRAIGSIHAGWRGTAENIVVETVAAMASKWRTRPEDIRAAIGPSIGRCCYEVGPEVAARFGNDGTAKAHIDLPSENEKQLRAAGVQNIWKSGECTFCAAQRFFSFRREHESAGRMISFIGIV
jgi:polyphenol oxidase